MTEAPAEAIATIEPEQILRIPANTGLWWRGEVPPQHLPRVGVIGSRQPTDEQRELAFELGHHLASAGAVVVSGGAQGVDAAALAGAVAAGGRALAVLPSALDVPFPPSNRDLFDAVVSHGGGLLAGFAPGTDVARHHFLMRNVLMVKVIDALVTVCAGPRSGSLHCAGRAWQTDLPVFAVPWSPRSPHCEGSNGLLAAGARAVWDAAGCERLVAELRVGRGERLLARDRTPPGHGGGVPVQATPPDVEARRADSRVIDAPGGGWQCYRAEAVTSRSVLGGLPGCDADLASRLVKALQEAGARGLPLEELAQAAGAERGEVAALAMRLVLLGRMRRQAGGCFALLADHTGA